MRKQVRILLGVGFSSLLIAGFQNCSSKVQFASAVGNDGLMHALVPLDNNGDDSQNPPENPPSSDDGHKNCNHDHGHDTPTIETSDDGLVGCILDYGKGKSSKLGIISGSLTGDQSRAQSVCLPADICLNEVSQHFNVKTEVATNNGVCHGNPNVQHLSADEALALLK